MCTRVFWNDNGTVLVAGRTMDWPDPATPLWVIFPRGSFHDGGLAAGETVVPENPLHWRSTYGTLVVTLYGAGAIDGVNERGLAAHLLYLDEADFGPRDPSKPGVQAALWAQYLLDHAATVPEALAQLDDIQIVKFQLQGYDANLHLALEDATGDSAVVEFTNGGVRSVHHGRQYQVMANSPTYDEQLALAAKVDTAHPSAGVPLPGNITSAERFQRATYFLSTLPDPRDERDGVAGLLSVLRNASVPFGAPYDQFGIYDTQYRTMVDLTNMRSYFEYATLPNVIWTDVARLDFSEGSGVRLLDPDDFTLAGDVTDQFAPAPAPY
jgi:penicillin V acylase-like amidase (Ntn superfamily)